MKPIFNLFYYVGELFLKQEKIIYKGEWLNNKRHGQGTLINNKTSYSYSGNWINDAPESYIKKKKRKSK